MYRVAAASAPERSDPRLAAAVRASPGRHRDRSRRTAP